jgi:hypothetical protein
MRRNQKQETTYYILLSILLIGVVYAILQANLQINGTAKIQANTWDIHFDNIQVNENSVSIGTGDSAATIDAENNCKVDFEVTLSIPGDFYEFTIDVVNAGTIDGMIGELNKTLKVNNEVVSEVPDYLDYSVTYEDGVEIEQNHKIDAGITETYLVRLEFKIDIEELPQATTITTSLEPQYLQADNSASKVLHYQNLYDIFQTELQNNSGLVHEYTGEHKDSFSITGNEKIYHWYASSNSEANTILGKWNVLFGGFCWQMYRTTDTGGVRVIYNGVPNNGKCTAMGTDQQIGTSQFNEYYNSPAYVGYMYNPNTLVSFVANSAVDEGSLFGMNVTYDYSNGLYTLTNPGNSYNGAYHYSCNNTIGTCSTVRYYYYNNYYVELNDGRNARQALNDMLNADNVNLVDSTIKTFVDTWYQNNLITYSNQLEDTIFCNDRSIKTLGGWNPSGGGTSDYLFFRNFSTLYDLKCPNETDQFSLYNNKAHLNYPIGLMTKGEANLLNNSRLLDTDVNYWYLSPNEFNGNTAKILIVNNVEPYVEKWTSYYEGVRPIISLKPGTKYRLGNGSKNNPYIVE